MAFDDADWTDATPKKSDVAAVKQHFWADDEGAHVATVDGDATSGPNVLIDSDGMDVRDGADMLAHFGGTAVIGREDGAHVEIGADSTAFYGAAGAKVGSIDSGANTVIPVSFGYLYQSVEPGGSLTKKVEPGPYFALEPVTVGVDRVERQSGTYEPVILWSQRLTFTEYGTQTLQDGTLLTLAANPTRQGQATVTFERTDSGTDTYLYNIFFVYQSVIRKPSYLFGTSSDAADPGAFGFAAGQSVAAGGYGSAAFGEFTTAAGDGQAVFGRNNLVDTDGRYAVIVGNGFVDPDHLHRGEPGSNALTLDWDGNLEAAGNSSALGAKLVYEAGDTAAVDMDTAGFVTASATSVRFAIPLCKPVADGVAVTLESPTFILRGVKGYTHSTSASTRAIPTAVACTLDGNAVTVWATFEATTNATNNTPTGVDVEGTLVFG